MPRPCQAPRGCDSQDGTHAATPFDVCPEPNKRYSYYMGQDIAALMECDAILLLSGWSESQGCQLEWRCAEIYRKAIFHHQNEIPSSCPE